MVPLERRIYYLAVVGILLLSLGVILTFSKTWLLEFMVPALILKPDTTIEQLWRKYPVELPTRMYLFNWTNPEDILETNTKPKLEEIGPYEFLQSMEKINIVWNDNNNTVTFNQVRTFRFDEEHTNANLSDTITTINILALSIAHKLRYWNYWLKLTMSSLMNTATTRHLTTTVNELLLEGYHDLIVDMAKQFSFLVPEVPYFEKFAFFPMRNGSTTYEGVYNMGNGMNGDFQVYNWNYKNETSYYDRPCSKVHGTVGELHSPNLSKDYLGMFYMDACRNLLLEYENDVVVNGISGYKYSVGQYILDNGTLIPENKCYCVGECMPSGVLNTTGCRYGMPLFLSLPHFYDADPIYLNAVEGLKPEKEKHETYIMVEPETGIPLQAMFRIQLNFLLHPIEDIDMFEDVPEIYFPFLWLEVEMKLPDHLVHMLKMILNIPITFTIISITLVTSGLCLLLVTVVCKLYCMFLYNKLSKQKRTTVLKPEEVPLQREQRLLD